VEIDPSTAGFNLHVTLAISPLRQGEVPAAARVLSGAFARDGIISHFFTGRRGRVAYPALFRSILYEHVDSGVVNAAWSPDRRLLGVAIWASPHLSPPSFGARLMSRVGLVEARLLFPFRSRELLSGLNQLSHLPPDQVRWHLVFVAVEPARHGEGIGAALLAPGLALADAEGVPSALETPFPETYPFYRRLGFEVVGTVTPFTGLAPLTIMTREPRTPETGKRG
jgi:GNAT superfamily N-acetyltransferase